MPGLKHYWPFCGDILDYAGNAHLSYGANASFIFGPDGNENSALRLEYGYLILPDRKYFYDSFSVSTWVRLNRITNWARLIESCETNSKTIAITVCSVLTPNPKFMNYPINSITSSKALVLGKWHHLSATFNGSIGKLYIDGIVVGTSQMNKPVNVTRTFNYIGRSFYYYLNDENLFADLFDLKIFNRGLSQEEIVNDMIVKK